MHIFYFLPVSQQFELLKEVSANSDSDIGLTFRRFTPSGFDARYEVCSWGEDLATKYMDGGFTQIILSVNGAIPNSLEDWDFTDREQENLIIIENGREKNDELEKSYLRVFSKESNCKGLYQKIRKQIKSICHQGLYIRSTFDKTTFYSDMATEFKMVFEFDGDEYTLDEI